MSRTLEKQARSKCVWACHILLLFSALMRKILERLIYLKFELLYFGLLSIVFIFPRESPYRQFVISTIIKGKGGRSGLRGHKLRLNPSKRENKTVGEARDAKCKLLLTFRGRNPFTNLTYHLFPPVFPLFNIVQFRNDPCRSTSSLIGYARHGWQAKCDC